MNYKGERLSHALRVARERAGLSQRALSARSGLTQSHISQIERGTLEPGLATLIDLARALNLELVLVPKRLLPAVNGLLRAEPTERDLSPEAGRAAVREIGRGERLLEKHKALYGSSADLDRIADILRFLRHAPLRTADLKVVSDAVDALRRYQASKQAHPQVAEIAATLQALRNRIAHDRADAPRPAYALDGDDYDA